MSSALYVLALCAFVLIILNISDIVYRRRYAIACSGKIECTSDGGIVVDTGSKCSKFGTRTYRKTGACTTTKTENIKEIVCLKIPRNMADVWFSLNVRIVATFNVLEAVQVATWSIRHVGFYNKQNNIISLSAEPEIFMQYLSQDTDRIHLRCPVVTTRNFNQVVVNVSGYRNDPNLGDTVTWGVEIETLEHYKRK